jgi:hypothetical protein
MDEGAVEVPVFDAVAATTVEVAGSTVVAGRSADALGSGQEVGPLRRVPGQVLRVRTGTVVAHEAVDVALVGDVERVVFPPVPGVTGRAGRLIALDAEAEVVEGVLLPEGNRFVVPFDLDRGVLPQPVLAVEHLLTGILMAFEARPRDIGSRLVRPGHECGVVGVWQPIRDTVPRIVGLACFRRLADAGEDDDRGDDEDQDRDETDDPVFASSSVRLRLRRCRDWRLGFGRRRGLNIVHVPPPGAGREAVLPRSPHSLPRHPKTA